VELQIIKPRYRFIVLLAALIIPVVINAVFTYLPYRQGGLPHGGAFYASLIIGLLLLSQYKGKTNKGSAIVILITVPVVVVALLATSLYVSCANGDCL
jgi:hypothetical protein